MGIWAKLFGRRSDQPPPQHPSPAAPFQDRPPVRRILYYLQHAVLRDSALMSHGQIAEVIVTGRISEENARYFGDPSGRPRADMSTTRMRWNPTWTHSPRAS